MSQSQFIAAVVQTESIPDDPLVTAEGTAAGTVAPNVFRLHVDMAPTIAVREI